MENKLENNEIKPLISIYEKDGEIEYSYSDDNAETINLNIDLLIGTFERIKKQLLELEEEEEDEEQPD